MKLKLALISDNHCSGLEKEIAFAIKSEGADAIISLGDIGESCQTDELVRIMSPFCEIGIPFLALPGNYETPEWWKEAGKKLAQYKNYIDLSQKPVFNFRGLDFIVVPGCEKLSKGMWIDNEQLVKAVQNLNSDKKVLLSHEPVKQDWPCGTDYSIQAIDAQGNVSFGRMTKKLIEAGFKTRFVNTGSDFLKRLVNRFGINFCFSGHIHEAMYAPDKNGRQVEPGEFSDSIYFNPGCAKKGNFAFVTLDKDALKASYERRQIYSASGYSALIGE